MTAVEFQNVSKIYRRHSGQRLLRDHVRDLFRSREDNSFYALRDVSFRVEAGERVGIVGQNGAGKSTTLSIVAGLSPPERGQVRVSGRVAALLELGSGFHHDLTGIENIKLNASLLGFRRKQTLAMIDEIVAFSELGDFVREPIRTYSSGMVMRLAFSVAINLNPDILITDEILTVGDAPFQEKCLARIQDLTSAGKTILSVSHSPAMVRMLCDRAIWLDHGRLVMDGKAAEVLQAYADRFAVHA